MRKIIIMLLCGILTTSCSLYKKYQRPESIEVDPMLYGEVVIDSTSITDFGWESLFTDPILQDLIRKALAQNTDLHKAKLSVEQANEGLRMAKLAYIPSFNLAPEGSYGTFISSSMNTGSSWLYTAPITASWEIDIFGKLTNKKRASKESYEMSKDYEQAVVTGLIAAVATQYYTLISLDEQLASTREVADRLAKSAEVMQEMMNAGMANRAAVSQMMGAHYSAMSGVKSLEHAIVEIENSLSTLLCETPSKITRGKFSDSSFPTELKTGLPIALLTNRPDVRIAEHNLAIAYYGVKAARAAQYPSINLSGSAGWTNNIGGTIVNPTGAILGAAGSLFLPLFNAGALRGATRIEKSKMEQARLDFQQTILNAGAEVNNAISLYQIAVAKEQYRKNEIASLKVALESTELLKQHSSTTYLEVLTAEQSLLSAETNASTDRLEKVTAIINLYHALGGGTK